MGNGFRRLGTEWIFKIGYWIAWSKCIKTRIAFYLIQSPFAGGKERKSERAIEREKHARLKTVMYQMHNIFTYRVKHSSSTAWLRWATYKCIELRFCLLFLCCAVCLAVFFLFIFVLALRSMMWQFSNKNVCRESSAYPPFLHCCGFLATIRPAALAGCRRKVMESTDNITFACHGQANSLVRLIRAISHCFSAASYQYARKAEVLFMCILYAMREYPFVHRSSIRCERRERCWNADGFNELPVCPSVRPRERNNWKVLKFKSWNNIYEQKKLGRKLNQHRALDASDWRRRVTHLLLAEGR